MDKETALFIARCLTTDQARNVPMKTVSEALIALHRMSANHCPKSNFSPSGKLTFVCAASTHDHKSVKWPCDEYSELHTGLKNAMLAYEQSYPK